MPRTEQIKDTGRSRPERTRLYVRMSLNRRMNNGERPSIAGTHEVGRATVIGMALAIPRTLEGFEDIVVGDAGQLGRQLAHDANGIG